MNENQIKRNEYIESKIERHKDYYSNRAVMWVKEANNTESSIRNYLFAFVIFLFTFSPIGVNTGKDFDNIWYVIFVWSLLILSLVFGAIHIIQDLKFYIIRKDEANRIEGLWASTKPNDESYNNTISESATTLPKNTSFWPLALQSLFSSLGFLFILIGYLVNSH